MQWSYELARVMGIPIKVHVTFLLLLIFVALFPQWFGLGEPLTGVLLICMVFLCVVLHELGHCAAALFYDYKIRDIILLPIGGVARMESMPQKPYQEIVIALAGPAVTALLVGGFFTLLMLGTLFYPTLLGLNDFILKLGVINLVLLIFNLIPAFPLDGGRVLRASLAWMSGWVRGTQIAVNIGKGFALLFFVIGIFYHHLGLPFIALVIYYGGLGEQRAVLLRSRLEKITAGQAMLTPIQTVFPLETLGSIAVRFFHSPQRDFPVVENGELVGIVLHQDLIGALQQGEQDMPVSTVMQHPVETAHDWEGLDSLYLKMAASKLSAIVVLRENAVVGIVTPEQIGNYHMRMSISRGLN